MHCVLLNFRRIRRHGIGALQLFNQGTNFHPIQLDYEKEIVNIPKVAFDAKLPLERSSGNTHTFDFRICVGTKRCIAEARRVSESHPTPLHNFEDHVGDERAADILVIKDVPH